MSAMERVTITDLGPELAGYGSIVKDVLEKARSAYAKRAWQWFNTHKEDTVLTKKIWFYTITIHVKDCRFVVEELFGKETA